MGPSPKKPPGWALICSCGGARTEPGFSRHARAPKKVRRTLPHVASVAAAKPFCAVPTGTADQLSLRRAEIFERSGDVVLTGNTLFPFLYQESSANFLTFAFIGFLFINLVE